MKLLSRTEWLKIINLAIAKRNWEFARQAADEYLQFVPNDLEITLLKAQALLGLGKAERAAALATALAEADPEFAEAYSILGQALPEGDERQTVAAGALAALSGANSPTPPPNAPAWGKALRRAYEAMKQGELERAQAALFAVLPGNEQIALLAVAHLRLIWAEGDWAATLHLARRYHKMFPRALPIRLILAHHLAQSGEEAQSVALLHAAANDDPAQRVVRRLFGNEHPYRALWPDNLSAPLELPLPADIAAALGINILSAPKTAPEKPHTNAEKSSPAPKKAAQAPNLPPEEAPPPPNEPPRQAAPPRPNLKEIAKRLTVPSPTEADGRFPCYVVLSSRKGLEEQYGLGATKSILEHAHRLVEAVNTREDWEAILLLADDPTSAKLHGVKPVNHSDPWAVKRLLAELDKALARKGSMVGAVLILGGDKVIPFHQLPNPVEDADNVVHSDAPYGSRDENFLVPEWPVGRLPDSADGDPGLLLSALRRITTHHRASARRVGWWKRLLEALRARLKRRKPNIGYTAEVWERAALSVFRSIGSPKALWTSPPTHAEAIGRLPRAEFGYFNLHGLVDASAWYGQSDPTRPNSDSPDYPVALRPQDVPQNGRSPKVVVTEACYGAHVMGKTPQTSLALRFLLNGVHAFVGSTATAYASLEPPLAGADLLIRLFWQRLKAGAPAGEALRQAKVYFAREMHRKQGFLDAEDQKTLMEFVLYGDPLYSLRGALAAKGVLRPPQSLPVLAAREEVLEEASLPPRVLSQVKKMARAYLPGTEGFSVQVAAEALEGEGSRAKGGGIKGKVVVVSKSVPAASFTHRHYVRITMNAKGKVVKVSVSR